jgi:Zn-dependent protease
VFLILTLIFKPSSLLYDIGERGFYINLFLAGFNMLPIPPFDGEKVLKWNPIIWAIVGVPLIGYMLFVMFW